MNFSLVLTKHFDKEAKPLTKKHKSLQNDLATLFQELKLNPTLGKHIGRNCYKIRLAISSKGKGKSGGARVITLVRIVQEKVYLLSIYDKADKEDLSPLELEELLRYAQA